MGIQLQLFILVLGIFVQFGSSCQDFGKEDFRNGQTPPRTLVSADPEHIKFFNGNYSVVIDGIGIEIRFDCWAPYPIDVQFNGHLTNRGATVGVIERQAKDPNDVSTYCFSINVTLTAYEEITGEYSCVSVQNETLRTSHYIYHAAHPPETLLNRNTTRRVVLRKDETVTILPCATSNPHVTVYLSKEVNGNWAKLVLDGSALRYNPQLGFIVQTSLIYSNSNQPTRYRCSTELSDLDFVDIIVIRPKPVIPTPPQKIIVVEEGSRLEVTCEASQEIIFENSNKEISGETLRDHKGGAEYAYTYRTTSLRAGEGGVVSCVSAVTRETLFDWSFSTMKRKNETAETGGHRGDGASHKHSLNAYECKLADVGMRIALHDCANWIECNLRKCNYLDRKCGSIKCDDAKTSNCVQNGIIQCFNFNNESAQTEIFFSGLQNRKIYTWWKAAPPQSILKIRKNAKKGSEILRNLTGETFEVELACEGSAFVFAVGFKWFLINEGKIGNPIQVSDENIQHKWKHLDSKNVIKSIAKMNVTRKVSQIICKAPIWNSTEWKEDAYNMAMYHEGEKQRESNNADPSRTSIIVSTIALLLKIQIINSLLLT